VGFEAAIEAHAHLQERGTAIDERQRLARQFRLEAEIQDTTVEELREILAQGKLAIAFIGIASILLRHNQFNIRPRRRLHAFAQKETWVRRLIVGDVLPGDGKAILRVVHEGVDAVLGGDGGGIDAHGFVVLGAEHDFFAPVAENVAAEARSLFGAVVRQAVEGGEDGFKGLLHPVPAEDAIAIEEEAE
jgi:hypothetical protein